MIRQVLAESLYWVATNAGYDGQAVIDRVREMPAGHGLNALTGEFGDLFEFGVIDPVRVTRLTIQHAAPVAALMLTTEALVAEQLLAQRGAIIAPGSADGSQAAPRASRCPGAPSSREWVSPVSGATCCGVRQHSPAIVVTSAKRRNCAFV